MIGEKGENLIFLVSQPRAGSTLLQLMLSGHPEVATTSEPWVALHPFFALRKEGLRAVYDARLSFKATEEFLRQAGVDEAFYKEQVGEFLVRLYNHAASHFGKRYFLDKTPRYYHIIEDLLEVFPEARFIVLFRNPLAVLSSILKTWVKDDILALSEYRDDLVTAPGKMLGAVSEGRGNVLKVNYEQLIKAPESELGRICGFLGIDYSGKMLEYGERSDRDWKFGDPVGVHKSAVPTPASLDKWKQGFNTPQLAYVARSYLDELGPELVAEMGYDFSELEAHINPPEDTSGLVPWSDLMKDNTLEVLLRQREELFGTLSWRVTAPLRALERAAKKVLKRG